MSKSRTERRLLLTIAAGVQTISLFCVTLAAVVMVQFGVESIPINIVNETSYYEAQSETLKERVTELTLKCGLPESIVDGVFDSDEIMIFTKEYTANRIHGFEDTLETAPVMERLRANLYYYMDDQGMDMGILDMDALNNYLSQAASLYMQTVNNGFISSYQTLRTAFVRPAVGVILAGLVMTAVCMVFMYKLTGMRRKMLSYTIRGTLSCAILCGVLAAWRFIFHGQTGVVYSPEYMEVLCRTFEDFFFKQFAVGMIVWLGISALCGGMIMRIKYHKKEKIR